MLSEEIEDEAEEYAMKVEVVNQKVEEKPKNYEDAPEYIDMKIDKEDIEDIEIEGN